MLGDKVTDISGRLPLGALLDSGVGLLDPGVGLLDPGVGLLDPGVALLDPGVDCAPVAVVAAPLARLTARQLRLLGRMLRPGETARLATAGRVVLPLAGPVDAALAELADAGLIVSGEHILSAVTACSGMSCARSLADVRSLAGRVPGLATGFAGVGPVHWAGCGRRCGLPADATAVVAVSADQFEISGPA